MYVDESGDIGTKAGASPFFSLAGLAVHESYWERLVKDLNTIKNSLLAKYNSLPVDELHIKHFLARSCKNRPLPKKDAYLLYRELLQEEARLDYIRLFHDVLSKEEKGNNFRYFLEAWERLMNRFEYSLRARSLISPYRESGIPEKGLLIVDRTNEIALRDLTRQMRRHSSVPSYFGGTNTEAVLKELIEDPIHKDSKYSLPIQFCDANAYFAAQLFHPSKSTIRHKAKNHFYALEPILLKEASRDNALGIVRR